MYKFHLLKATSQSLLKFALSLSSKLNIQMIQVWKSTNQISKLLLKLEKLLFNLKKIFFLSNFKHFSSFQVLNISQEYILGFPWFFLEKIYFQGFHGFLGSEKTLSLNI